MNDAALSNSASFSGSAEKFKISKEAVISLFLQITLALRYLFKFIFSEISHFLMDYYFLL